METLLIKNMVCPRCVMAVEEQLTKAGLPYQDVFLGKVILKKKLLPEEHKMLQGNLEKIGFQILEDQDSKKIELIKNLLQQIITEEDIPPGFSLSVYLTSQLGKDYSTLSYLFSSLEGITIEHFFINLKINKVKEWLFYQEMQLSEMAWSLGYSSVQHLSSQFKKVTGMTPTDYRKLVKKGGLGWKV
ncbi:helix-turn-helix domain-containing protein [Mongoliibacter ruber]|uniref:AraC-like DNA-binding protein n=1 Tax=Mongoliibacter ruber TaxID=1750599 RepID=A0A2T0WCG2_9BACT|nr:AraC family transcriptional regulator [Mongoliibacter ruber]PRY84393.1 AraC-like DNA-binding protein [Mongoliibacter ruber]